MAGLPPVQRLSAAPDFTSTVADPENCGLPRQENTPPRLACIASERMSRRKGAERSVRPSEGVAVACKAQRLALKFQSAFQRDGAGALAAAQGQIEILDLEFPAADLVMIGERSVDDIDVDGGQSLRLARRFDQRGGGLHDAANHLPMPQAGHALYPA